MKTRTSSVSYVPNADLTGLVFCFSLIILLFSSISLPAGSPIGSVVGEVLGSLPGVAVVANVDSFSLTQVRYSDLNVAIPVAFLLMVVVLVRNGKRTLSLRMNIAYAFLLVFALIAGTSALFYKEYVEALKLAVYVVGIACFFSFEDEERKGIARKLLSICLVAGIVNAGITIWQYGSMASWEFSPSTIRLYRPDGIFGDSIISALFSNVTIAVLALGATRLKAPVRIIVILLCMVAGVVTGARTFYYLLVIVGAYLMLAKTRDVSLEKKALLLCLMIAVVAVVASPLGQSMIDSLTFQDIVSSRDIKRQLAIEQFGNSPVFGIGTGQYAIYEASLGMPANSGLHGTNPHNVYVQVLCENGLVGFIPFVLGLICSLWLAFKRKNALAVVLLVIYTAIGWSLGILYSIAFTSFFVVFVCSLLGTSEDYFSVVTMFNMAARALQLVVTVALVRILSVEDYASYTVFFTTSSTILGIAGQSIALAYVRYNTERMTKDRAYRDSLIFISHAINVACLVLLLVGSYPMAEAMGVAHPVMLAAIVYGFLLGTVQLNIAFFQSRELYAKSGVVENAKQLTLLACIALAVVLAAGSLESILASYCFSGLACFVISLTMIGKLVRHGDAAIAVDFKAGREFLAVSAWLILYSVATQLYNQANITMLASFGSTQAVAEFGVASKYFNMVLLFLPSIKTVLRVRMSKAEMTESTEKQREFAIKWFKKTTVPFGALVAICCVGAQLVFPVLNGDGYDASIPMFQILCINAFSAYVFAPASALIMSLNRYGLQFAIALISLAINLVGNYLLIPLYGGIGTSIATTISQIALNVMMTVVVFRVGAKSIKLG